MRAFGVVYVPIGAISMGAVALIAYGAFLAFRPRRTGTEEHQETDE